MGYQVIRVGHQHTGIPLHHLQINTMHEMDGMVQHHGIHGIHGTHDIHLLHG